MGINIIAFLIVLGVLIFIHEFGHFLVARLFGVGVEKFSLGFGPRIFGKKVGITDYR
ncbi:MAG: RIP metalloprotease RseP, partial [Desulfobacterales bacterium]|nr:RIP metalloprotease RseP [Desulfobacterales bacterium]